MARIAPVLAVAAAMAAAAVLVSGGSSADPQTPPALPGKPPPFLGTAVAGSGGLTAAIDAYGSVVDLRPTGPAGEPAIDNPSDRQAAGTVPPDTGIVLRVGMGSASLPLWRADRVRQSYLPGTNVVRTAARVGAIGVTILDAAAPAAPALVRRVVVEAPPVSPVSLSASVNLNGNRGAACASNPPGRRHGGRDDDAVLVEWRSRGSLSVDLTCSFGRARPAAGPIGRAVAADRDWLRRARPLGAGAPRRARRLYARSLLVLRALTDRRSGAVAAGARDGWAYVWPRDAGTVAIALAAAGYRSEASRVARFLGGLDLDAGPRFRGDGAAVDDGRPLQGDAAGWVAAAARAAGLRRPVARFEWRDRADYGERSGDRGDYLANAIAAGAPAAMIRAEFDAGPLLVRRANDPASGADAAAAWAVRPFPRPPLFAEVSASLDQLLAAGGRFGIAPAEGWPGGESWSAPTAWVAWSLAALGERREALRLLAALDRAATGAGTLPERVDPHSGIARSTTPLAWSHAFAILAMRELWPGRPARG
jgi:hypothetical protein